MKISDIKDPKLRALAESRVDKSYDYKEFLETNNLINAFDWSDSPEGWHFWDGVDDGIITSIPEPRKLTIEQAEKKYGIKIINP